MEPERARTSVTASHPGAGMLQMDQHSVGSLSAPGSSEEPRERNQWRCQPRASHTAHTTRYLSCFPPGSGTDWGAALPLRMMPTARPHTSTGPSLPEPPSLLPPFVTAWQRSQLRQPDSQCASKPTSVSLGGHQHKTAACTQRHRVHQMRGGHHLLLTWQLQHPHTSRGLPCCSPLAKGTRETLGAWTSLWLSRGGRHSRGGTEAQASVQKQQGDPGVQVWRAPDTGRGMQSLNYASTVNTAARTMGHRTGGVGRNLRPPLGGRDQAAAGKQRHGH
ncbi:PREDICTED: uncharacterized protein LOC102016669 isoform X3 [Chinchilla lanigera]|uniref:uncharacterized protein LOC102016669 isoform X3 n=1 Tax=Chinchilla lanigera TaxID=34839 RepID=UPI00038EEFC7|nr:PREDICTED: uncharacterized protein LOC102016669 isoform X3 [Chinchilla lanigera]XP_013360658.1 PREDICTED: uncharacterized protein LOC102016669 isoform X3 [Chinchilla lanigera]